MGAFHLGKMTLRSVFKEPETVCYPAVAKPACVGFKGHVVIDVTSCVLCGICAKRCPADALSVDRSARTWTIDGLRCVQCFSCVYACPKKSLGMDGALPTATSSKGVTAFGIPEA